MNDDISIRVENLGKLYRIGEREPYKTLRDSLARSFRRWRHLGSPEKLDQYIWALKGVSFNVSKGEVVGIIGTNGAGKSTLLKILSRIAEPTEGYAEVFGRVGSLLEIGTGFHPELTGRENVYLSGAILGMKKREIEDKFNDIVAFAELEKFISTPVKYYSSGMYVRLAFAVAAHLEPEVLLVDEVLAVGDAGFQKKCLGKMGQVAGEGRTVLFVSHNMAAVENLCQRVVVLDQGRVVFLGSAEAAIRTYMSNVMLRTVSIPIASRNDRRGNGKVRIVSFHIEDENGKPVQAIRTGQNCTFAFGYRCKDNQPQRNVVVSFAILNSLGVSLILHRTNFTGQNFQTVPPQGIIRCQIPRFPLVADLYFIGTYVEVGNDVSDDPGIIAQFTVEEGDFFGTGNPGISSHSPFLVEGSWSISDNS
jgi:lipopolysaccharide transport system ATP-binding protein